MNEHAAPPCRESAEALLTKWQGLVYYCLDKLSHRPLFARLHDEVESELWLALWRSAVSYRPGPVDFAGFAVHNLLHAGSRVLRRGFDRAGHERPWDHGLLDRDAAPEPEYGPEDLDALAHALAGLHDSFRRVLALRYGLGGNKPLILKDCGALLGVTRERVRQLQVKALQRLRDRMK
jgi:RNA polymerase sigma factor (sigma-70 family)